MKEFLKDVNEKVAKGCFGIAGPVKKGKSQATNLPWLNIRCVKNDNS